MQRQARGLIQAIELVFVGVGERLSSPLFTITWQVVQAQLPPQACSS